MGPTEGHNSESVPRFQEIGSRDGRWGQREAKSWCLGHSRVCATKGSEETPCPEALGPPGTAPARLGTVTPCPALSIPPHPSGLRDLLGPVPGEPWSGMALGAPSCSQGLQVFPRTLGFAFALESLRALCNHGLQLSALISPLRAIVSNNTQWSSLILQDTSLFLCYFPFSLL